MIRIPKPLAPGDTVALIGISGALRGDDIPGDIRTAVSRLEALGFRVKLSPSCSARYGFLSGTDAERAAAINDAFADDSVDGVWCIRGGYGCIRLMDRLDREVISANPKPFIGYSDITTIHSVLNNLRMASFHGPMPKSDELTGDVRESLMHAITGNPDPVLKNMDGTSLRCLREGVAEGELVGGNLSLVASAVGTPDGLDVKGKLLFLEDVGEYTYAIDRYLQHLYNAGYFKACKGVIFGGFTRCLGEHEGFTFTMDEILQQLTERLQVPVIAGLQAGHLKETLTIPLGRTFRMDAGAGEIKLIK